MLNDFYEMFRERDTEIITMRKDGFSMVEIGKKHGISRQRVAQILKNNDVHVSIKSVKVNEASALLADGYTVPEICRSLKIKSCVIYKNIEQSKRTNAINRFWKMVDVRGPDECWEWKGCKYTRGYGMYPHNSYAHRYMWVITYGDIPDGLIVRHSCDNPSCVNPKHLLIGTHKDNTRDMIERGRSKLRPRQKGEHKQCQP